MINKDTELGEKQFKAIQLLMRSLPVAEVAREIGVSRVSIYRWLKNDLFNAELNKRKNELIRRASRKLAGALDQAGEVLIDLLEAKNPSVRRLAAGNVYDYCQKFSNITDLEDRIKALEDERK